jgi:hypothetical protein
MNKMYARENKTNWIMKKRTRVEMRGRAFEGGEGGGRKSESQRVRQFMCINLEISRF